MAKWAFDRLTASAAYAAAVPGGAWNVGEEGAAGPDQPSAYPYGVFRVRAEKPEWFSGTLYVQAFPLYVAAYAPIGQVGSSPTDVQQAIWSALAWNTTTTLRGLNERVVECRPVEATDRYEKNRRAGRDVFLSGQSFRVTVQGDRGNI